MTLYLDDGDVRLFHGDARVPQMEPCSWCSGVGMRAGAEGVFTCAKCGGGGRVEARDEKGRFLPWVKVR